MKIRNVIFELGGVILKLDYKKTFLAFVKLGIHNIELTVRRHCLRILEDFETGKISINDFQSAIEQKINVKITTTEFEHAWNALILDIPVNHLQLIKHVKLSYKTYLLSNINALHYAAVQQLLQHQHQLTSLKDYFDKEYY